MIELGHIATGALLGKRCAGPVEAALTGVFLHGLMDVAPHGEVGDRRFEIGSTFAGLALLGARYGVRSPILWGAVGGVLPDVEHVLPQRIRPSRELFPTHSIKWLHSSDKAFNIPAWVQVVAGGAVVGALVFARATDSSEQHAGASRSRARARRRGASRRFGRQRAR